MQHVALSDPERPAAGAHGREDTVEDPGKQFVEIESCVELDGDRVEEAKPLDFPAQLLQRGWRDAQYVGHAGVCGASRVCGRGGPAWIWKRRSRVIGAGARPTKARAWSLLDRLPRPRGDPLLELFDGKLDRLGVLPGRVADLVLLLGSQLDAELALGAVHGTLRK